MSKRINARRMPWLPALQSLDDAGILAAAAGPRPPGSRAGGARALGARADVRAATRAEPQGADLQLRRRAGDGEQEARAPHGVGEDAQGRLPALPGAARIPPALPER